MEPGKAALAEDRKEPSSGAKHEGGTVSLIRFLLQRNAITGQLALDALDHFQRTRVPIGRLAIREGLLGVGACIHVLERQAEEARFGRRRHFGEIAVDLGYLDAGKVGPLLEQQRTEGPSVGSVLLDLAGSDAEHLREELAAYERSRGRIP